MDYKNLTIVGTSHISKKSIKAVKEAIASISPDMVAIELDKRRLPALIEKKKNKSNSLPSITNIKYIGVQGYLFSLLGAYVERKLGNITGVSPGDEMLTAYKIAKKEKRKLALVDQDIQITLKRLSKSITLKERWHFFVDIIKALFGIKDKLVKGFDIAGVPEEELIQEILKIVKARYPSIYKVLIYERNKVISKNLFILMQNHKKVVAVLGAGHKEEVIEMIKDREILHFAQNQVKNS
ncbi:MAG: TraB/GumN family protein [Nanoarchaeota archaeon]|nr:TraB/GumN family protein [Nanoarchaeota archaeon]